MNTGSICEVRTDRGFGFVRPNGGGDDLFFHMSDLSDGLEFDEQLRERRVTFNIVASGKGPRAANIQPED